MVPLASWPAGLMQRSASRGPRRQGQDRPRKKLPAVRAATVETRGGWTAAPAADAAPSTPTSSKEDSRPPTPRVPGGAPPQRGRRSCARAPTRTVRAMANDLSRLSPAEKELLYVRAGQAKDGFKHSKSGGKREPYEEVYVKEWGGLAGNYDKKARGRLIYRLQKVIAPHLDTMIERMASMRLAANVEPPTPKPDVNVEPKEVRDAKKAARREELRQHREELLRTTRVPEKLETCERVNGARLGPLSSPPSSSHCMVPKARAGLDRTSTSPRRRRRHVSTEYPRRSRGVAATRLRNIHVAAAASPRRLHGISTSQPRRRRDASAEYPHSQSTRSARRRLRRVPHGPRHREKGAAQRHRRGGVRRRRDPIRRQAVRGAVFGLGRGRRRGRRGNQLPRAAVREYSSPARLGTADERFAHPRAPRLVLFTSTCDVRAGRAARRRLARSGPEPADRRVPGRPGLRDLAHRGGETRRARGQRFRGGRGRRAQEPVDLRGGGDAGGPAGRPRGGLHAARGDV